ncbi:MAG: hypothetical protein WA261_18945 [Candidatus Sulfotelmatobacter sp.]
MRLTNEAADPPPDAHPDRVNPCLAEKTYRFGCGVSAILVDGVVSIGVSPPNLAVALAGGYTTFNFRHFRYGARHLRLGWPNT